MAVLSRLSLSLLALSVTGTFAAAVPIAEALAQPVAEADADPLLGGLLGGVLGGGGGSGGGGGGLLDLGLGLDIDIDLGININIEVGLTIAIGGGGWDTDVSKHLGKNSDEVNWYWNDKQPPNSCPGCDKVKNKNGADWWNDINGVPPNTPANSPKAQLAPKIYTQPANQGPVCPPYPAVNSQGQISSGTDLTWDATPQNLCSTGYQDFGANSQIYVREYLPGNGEIDIAAGGAVFVYAMMSPINIYAESRWQWFSILVYLTDATDITSIERVCYGINNCFAGSLFVDIEISAYLFFDIMQKQQQCIPAPPPTCPGGCTQTQPPQTTTPPPATPTYPPKQQQPPPKTQQPPPKQQQPPPKQQQPPPKQQQPPPQTQTPPQCPPGGCFPPPVQNQPPPPTCTCPKGTCQQTPPPPPPCASGECQTPVPCDVIDYDTMPQPAKQALNCDQWKDSNPIHDANFVEVIKVALEVDVKVEIDYTITGQAQAAA